MWSVLWAQEPPSSSPVEWLQYGALGAVIVALLLGWLWAKPAVDRILRDNDRLQDEILAEVKATRAEVAEMRREQTGEPAP